MNHTQSNKRHKKFSSVGRDLTKEIFDGSTYKTKRKIDKIVVHCSFSPQGRGDDSHTIDRWHRDRWGSGIGYHYVVLEDGTIQKGRWVDNIGSHAKGYNVGSIAICRMGGMGKDGTAVHDATNEQINSIRKLSKLLCNMYDLPYSRILGHGELPNTLKSCPLVNMNLIRNFV